MIIKGKVAVLIKQHHEFYISKYEYFSHIKYLNTINEKN